MVSTELLRTWQGRGSKTHRHERRPHRARRPSDPFSDSCYVIADNRLAENAGWARALLTLEPQELSVELGLLPGSSTSLNERIRSGSRLTRRAWRMKNLKFTEQHDGLPRTIRVD